MKGLSKQSSLTGRENQRADFVDSLYKNLHKKTEAAIDKHNKLFALASTYLADGLDPQECAELIIIENSISREAANAYVNMAQSENTDDSGLSEYSFQFEDVHGKIFCSYDIGRVVRASSNEEAWEKAEEMIFSDLSIEPDRIISVDRIPNV